MHQSERVTSTSGNDTMENNDEDSDIDLDSWPGDSTSPNDSKHCIQLLKLHALFKLPLIFVLKIRLLLRETAII